MLSTSVLVQRNSRFTYICVRKCDFKIRDLKSFKHDQRTNFCLASQGSRNGLKCKQEFKKLNGGYGFDAYDDGHGNGNGDVHGNGHDGHEGYAYAYGYDAYGDAYDNGHGNGNAYDDAYDDDHGNGNGYGYDAYDDGHGNGNGKCNGYGHDNGWTLFIR